MHPGRSRLLATTTGLALLALAAAPSVGWGQTTAPADLFSRVETLSGLDGSPVAGAVSLAGDTAVVGGIDGVVRILVRAAGSGHWLQTASLTPSAGTADFGRSVSTDGTTTVVGANGAAYVFRRGPGQAWQQTATLTGTASSFGTSVSVSGTTAVVGETVPDNVPGRGRVHVFEQDPGDPIVWTEAAVLSGPPFPLENVFDGFGERVSIDHDTIVTGSVWPPSRFAPGCSTANGYVFSRDLGGPNAWGRGRRSSCCRRPCCVPPMR